MPHLWEVKHPYYCADSNYYARGDQQPVVEYASWSDFLDSEGTSDFDMNLLFRFDWIKADLEDERPKDKLYLFWMGQRKGLYRWSEIAIKDADEDAVRAWLQPRFDHLKKLWEPL